LALLPVGLSPLKTRELLLSTGVIYTAKG